MLRRLACAFLALVCLVSFSTAPARAAEELLRLVPDSALAFAAVNWLADVDAKLMQLGGKLQAPLPSMLAQLKEHVGIGPGLDNKGTLGLVLLAPTDGGPQPVPMLLVPVSDYRAFVGRLNAENADAKVTKIQVGPGQGWARQIGGYAAIADESHREVLEKNVQLSPKVPDALAAFQTWLAENDVAVVIFRPGIVLMSTQAQQDIKRIQQRLAMAGDQAKPAAEMLGLYAEVFKAAEKELTVGALGLRLDSKGALHLTKRLRLAPDSKWGRLAADVRPLQKNLLAGLPDGPFVVAGSAVVSPSLLDAMTHLSIKFMARVPQVYGLSDEQAKQLSEVRLSLPPGIQGMSMAFGVAPGGQSIYSNLIALMQVDDAQAFLTGYEKTMATYSELAKKVNSPMLPAPEIERTQIEGKPALQLTMKIPQPLAAQGQPELTRVMEALFGSGGKIVVWMAEADKHTVAAGYVDKDLLLQTIRAIRQGKPALAGQPDLAKTAAMLPPNALAVGYWSLKGTIASANRAITSIAAIGGAPAIQIPEFPAAPPIGLAITAGQGEIQGYVVVPAEVFEAIGAYVRKIKAGMP